MNEASLNSEILNMMKKTGQFGHLHAEFLSAVSEAGMKSNIKILKPYKQLNTSETYKFAAGLVSAYLWAFQLDASYKTVQNESNQSSIFRENKIGLILKALDIPKKRKDDPIQYLIEVQKDTMNSSRKSKVVQQNRKNLKRDLSDRVESLFSTESTDEINYKPKSKKIDKAPPPAASSIRAPKKPILRDSTEDSTEKYDIPKKLPKQQTSKKPLKGNNPPPKLKKSQLPQSTDSTDITSTYESTDNSFPLQFGGPARGPPKQNPRTFQLPRGAGNPAFAGGMDGFGAYPPMGRPGNRGKKYDSSDLPPTSYSDE